MSPISYSVGARASNRSLTLFFNSTGDFTEQHLVTNGASELFGQVFGPQGAHARSAFGVAQIPTGACVEIELIAEIG